MAQEGKISIRGLDRADVLAALYNASRPLGMGFMHYDPKPMSSEEAASILKMMSEGGHHFWFGYLKGRIMKIDLGVDDIDPRLYDRDVGEGAAEKVIKELREKNSVNTDSISRIHEEGTLESIEDVKKELRKETTIAQGEKIATVTLGLAHVADVLAPKIDGAEKQIRGKKTKTTS